MDKKSEQKAHTKNHKLIITNLSKFIRTEIDYIIEAPPPSRC